MPGKPLMDQAGSKSHSGASLLGIASLFPVGTRLLISKPPIARVWHRKTVANPIDSRAFSLSLFLPPSQIDHLLNNYGKGFRGPIKPCISGTKVEAISLKV